MAQQRLLNRRIKVKICSKCEFLQEYTNFYPDKRNKTGYCSWCKNCWKVWRLTRKEKFNAYRKQYRKQHPEKWLESSIKSKYGLSYSDYKEFLIDQMGHCALCPESKKLQVDHDHQTGKVRGLLCINCNRDLAVIEKHYNKLNKFLNYLGEKNYALTRNY